MSIISGKCHRETWNLTCETIVKCDKFNIANEAIISHLEQTTNNHLISRSDWGLGLLNSIPWNELETPAGYVLCCLVLAPVEAGNYIFFGWKSAGV